MKLYSSAFIGFVLGFLMVMGYNNQPVDIIKTEVVPSFETILRPKEPVLTDKIKIEIFDDLTCARCSDFFLNTLPKIRNLRTESSEVEVQLYFIPDINNDRLAVAALGLKCAADQYKFWEMLQKMHENASEIGRRVTDRSAQELKLDMKAFGACIDGKKFQNNVEADLAYASEKTVTVKPTLIINDYRLLGAQPFENIQRVVNQMIKQKTAATPPITITQPPTDLKKELEKAFQLPPENQPQELRIKD